MEGIQPTTVVKHPIGSFLKLKVLNAKMPQLFGGENKKLEVKLGDPVQVQKGMQFRAFRISDGIFEQRLEKC